MMRSNVVLPEPDGPSKQQFAGLDLQVHVVERVNWPNFLQTLRTSTLMRLISFPFRAARVFAFHPGFQRQRDDRQKRQQRRHGKGPGEIVIII